jgi:hypothetical protein
MADLIQLLIDVLTRQRQVNADSALLRQIVADNREPIHRMSGIEDGKVTVANAQLVDPPRPGYGWNEPRKLADWSPPGQKVFDALMDAEDAKWRAERAIEQAKLGLGGK